MAEEEWVAKYNTMQQYEIARLEAENRVQDAIRTTTQLAIQGEIDQLTATQSICHRPTSSCSGTSSY